MSLLPRGQSDRLRQILQIQKGAIVNTKDEFGFTPLHNLRKKYEKDNLIDIVKLLVENDADVTAKTIKYEWTPLHFF